MTLPGESQPKAFNGLKEKVMKQLMEMPSSHLLSEHKATKRNLFVVSTALMRTMICSALTFVSAMAPATAGDCPTAGTWSSTCTVSSSSSPLTGPVNVTSNLTIPSDVTVDIKCAGSAPECSPVLTIAAGNTLTNNGTITVDSSGTLAVSSPSLPTQGAVLVNPGTLTVNSGGSITGGGFIWNADSNNTSPGTLDNSGTIAPVVYGIGFQGTLADVDASSPTPSCGARIPETVTITVNTSTPSPSEATTWTFSADSPVPSITKSLVVPYTQEIPSTFSLTLFNGQSVAFSPGTITGRYFADNRYYSYSLRLLSGETAASSLTQENYGQDIIFELSRGEHGPVESNVELDITWLDPAFGVAADSSARPPRPGDFNMDLCTGTWAVSGPDSNPTLDTSDATNWSHLDISKGADGYEVAWRDYTAASPSAAIMTGPLTFDSSGCPSILPEAFPLTLIDIGKDSNNRPFISMMVTSGEGGHRHSGDPRRPCGGGSAGEWDTYHFLKVDLYVQVEVAASALDDGPGFCFKKNLISNISDYRLRASDTPSADQVWIDPGKNLFFEFVLMDDDVRFCTTDAVCSNNRSSPVLGVSASAPVPGCPSGYSAHTPTTTASLPSNIQSAVYSNPNANQPDRLFIFDYNNTAASYTFLLVTNGGDIDPTIVQKAHPLGCGPGCYD